MCNHILTCLNYYLSHRAPTVSMCCVDMLYMSSHMCTLCVLVHSLEVVSGLTPWFLIDIFVYYACTYDEVYIHMRFVM